MKNKIKECLYITVPTLIIGASLLYTGINIYKIVNDKSSPTCQLKIGPNPKFMRNDRVVFFVNHFYRNVCSGRGIVKELIIENNKYSYVVETPKKEKDCPKFITREESSLRLIGKIITLEKDYLELKDLPWLPWN